LSYSIKSQEKIDKNKVKLNVEVSSGYFAKSINKAYKEVSGKAKIPGFRKGKVPYQIIDINYGKEYVLSEAANIAISELYSEIIDSTDLKPIDYPKVDIDGELKQDNPVNFIINIEIEPEAVLPEYKGISAEGFPTDVTDEEIDAQIDNLRNRFASLEPVDEGDAVKKMDIITIDFAGTVDGKEFKGGSYSDYVLEVGSGVLLKELEKGLLGMKKGEEKTVAAKMPKEVEDKDIAGKKAQFILTVKEIKRKVLPVIDGEFLKNMGDFETADDLKKFIKENLEEQKKNARQNKIFSDIVDYLVKNSKIDVPEIMIENETKELAHDFEHRLKDQNFTKEQYMQYLKISEDKINEDLKNKAIFNVKEYIIFNTLEKELKDKITPSADELESEKEHILKSTKKDDDRKKVEEYLKTPSGEKSASASVIRKKLVDFLIANAKIKELTLDDLKKLNEKEGAGKTDLNNKETIEDFIEEEALVEEILSENKE
ncbi:MAG: trigger factor, partial [Candidatus Humimicrobiaceae bacterium]